MMQRFYLRKKKMLVSQKGGEMTKDDKRRDMFAAFALAGMLAHSRGNPPHGYRPRDEQDHWHNAIAEEAFEIAQAMMFFSYLERHDPEQA